MIRNNTADSTHHKAREYTEKEKKTKQTKNLSNITSGIEKKKKQKQTTQNKNKTSKPNPNQKKLLNFHAKFPLGFFTEGVSWFVAGLKNIQARYDYFMKKTEKEFFCSVIAARTSEEAKQSGLY